MTDAVAVFFLTALIVLFSNIHCSVLKRQATPPPNPKNFAGLTAERINPTTLSIFWNSGEFSNSIVQFRRSGDQDWQNVLKNGTVSATILVPVPSISSRIEPIRPVITKNQYDNSTDSIDLEFSIENHSLAMWPTEFRQLTTDVFVVECGQSSELIPKVRWISNSKGTVRFSDSYVSSVRSGNRCQILISVLEPSKICDQPIKIDGKLLDDAVLVEMNCLETENIQCPESKRKHVPTPRCNPQFVDAVQFSDENSRSAYEFGVRWDFDKNATVDGFSPRKFILRFGYTDVPTNSDQFLPMLAPMREIDRFEIHGASRNGTFRTNKTASELVHEKEPFQRFLRVSLCAIYGDDNESDDRAINWAILPIFTVKTDRSPKIEENSEKRCRCDEISTKNSEIVSGTSPTPPPIVSSPSHVNENFWTKVAPLLAVFSVMTVINLILLMASYYYYKKAKRLNAVK